MSMRSKMLSGYILIALVTVSVAYLSLRATDQLNATFDTVTQSNIPSINALNDMRYYAILAFAHASEMTLVVSNVKKVDVRSHIEHEINEVNQAYVNYAQALNHYHVCMNSRSVPAGSIIFDAVISESDKLLLIIRDLTDMVQTSVGIEEVIQKVEDIETQEPILLAAINEALNDEVRHLNKDQEEVYALITRTRDIAVVFGPLSILVAILMTMRHSKEFVRALITLKNSSLAVSSGNLDKRVPRLSNDEFEDVAQTFNDMASKLHTITTTMNDSRDYLEEILDSMIEPMVVTDLNGNMKTINRAMLELLGKSENELLHHSIVELFADEYKDEIVRIWIPSLKNNSRFYHKNSKYVEKNGREIAVIASASSLHDHKGVIDGMVYMGQPMSDLDLGVVRAE